MKKKVKDLQSEDIHKLCTQHQDCEFFSFAIPSYSNMARNFNKEIEIPNEPVGNTDQLEEEKC